MQATENKGMCAEHERLYEQLSQYIEEARTRRGVLIEVLHKAQELFGHLPVEVQDFVAQRLDVPTSSVYGVVTFYNFFTMKPRGKNQIKICLGTACYVKGADRVTDRFKEELKTELEEVTEDGLFSVIGVRCLGACSMAPVVLVGEKDFYGRVTPDEVPKIIKKYKG